MTKNKTKAATLNDKAIGARIHELRIAGGLTRGGVGTLLGITHQQLQKYEKGINRISIGRLIDLATIYNTTAVDIVGHIEAKAQSETFTHQRNIGEIMRAINALPIDYQNSIKQIAIKFKEAHEKQTGEA